MRREGSVRVRGKRETTDKTRTEGPEGREGGGAGNGRWKEANVWGVVCKRSGDTHLSVRTSLSNSSSVMDGDDMLWVATHSQVERAVRSAGLG